MLSWQYYHGPLELSSGLQSLAFRLHNILQDQSVQECDPPSIFTFAFKTSGLVHASSWLLLFFFNFFHTVHSLGMQLLPLPLVVSELTALLSLVASFRAVVLRVFDLSL